MSEPPEAEGGSVSGGPGRAPDRDPGGGAADSGSPPESTRRQEILELLVMGPWGFEELRRELNVPVKVLESDLRHAEKSLRRQGRRLVVEPAECRGCGFRFKERAERRFQPPSRCPRCKGQRIADPRLTIPAG